MAHHAAWGGRQVLVSSGRGHPKGSCLEFHPTEVSWGATLFVGFVCFVFPLTIHYALL